MPKTALAHDVRAAIPHVKHAAHDGLPCSRRLSAARIAFPSCPSRRPSGCPTNSRAASRATRKLVLLEESNLDKVADPTAGAGGFETLTADLCDKAWALVQTSEKAGGIAQQIASGALKAEIEKSASERARNVARRKDALTGASEFPNIAEKPVAVLAPIPAAEAPAHALFAHRSSEPYEALRDKSDVLAAKGKRPSVFLANIGPVAAFTARATFAKNFFEAGGIEAPGNEGFASTQAAAGSLCRIRRADRLHLFL